MIFCSYLLFCLSTEIEDEVKKDFLKMKFFLSGIIVIPTVLLLKRRSFGSKGLFSRINLVFDRQDLTLSLSHDLNLSFEDRIQ